MNSDKKNVEEVNLSISGVKTEPYAIMSLIALILSGIIFAVVGFLAETVHDESGIEDAMTSVAIPGVILALGGTIASLVFAFKATKKIINSEGKLKGKKLAYVVIAINVLWLMIMFN